jgi:hypothetical protein
MNENINFRRWFEATDIFGFDKDDEKEENPNKDNEIFSMFNTETMIEYLSKRKLGINPATVNFMNEIQWGNQVGAIKL